MKKKESKLKKDLMAAAKKVLSNESSSEEIKVKFYENSTDKLLIEKTLDAFLLEIEEIMSEKEKEDNSNK
jgi:hypothetical protein